MPTSRFSLADAPDLAGILRYGTSTAQKEALAAGASLPGAPVDQTENQDVANRYASGYLFAKQWPRLAPAVMPYVNMLKTSTLPIFGGSSPELQSYANAGMNQALIGGPDAPKAGYQTDALRSAEARSRTVGYRIPGGNFVGAGTSLTPPTPSPQPSINFGGAR